MCSSTRGPARAPSLVTWPTRTREKPRDLARRISSKLVARTWPTVPGALSMVSSHMVWMESMTTRARSRSASRVAAMSRTLMAAASCMGASDRPQALRAHADLVDGFLAGDVHDPAPGAGDGGGGLEHEGAFADAGVAADEHDGGRDEAAAEGRGRARRSRRGARGGGAAAPSSPTNWMRALVLARGAPGRASTASSTRVFHSPQASQRPAHLE